MRVIILLILLNASWVNDKNLIPFEITIEKSNKEIKLICNSGCEWKDLSINVDENITLKITQFGITGISDNSKVSNFEFHISREKNTLKFEGKKGTVWKDLTFTCKMSCNGTLNQEGIEIGK